jgi:hypothetical protein
MAGFTVVFLIWCCIAVPIGWGLARVESKVNNIPMRPTGARSVLLGLLAVTALMVAGCGGSHKTSGSGSRVGAGVLPNSPAAASSPTVANPTDWCSAFWAADQTITALSDKADQNLATNQEPGKGDWQQARSQEAAAAASLPQSVTQYSLLEPKMKQVVGDLNEIIAHGYDNTGAGEGLGIDVDQADQLAEASDCSQPDSNAPSAAATGTASAAGTAAAGDWCSTMWTVTQKLSNLSHVGIDGSHVSSSDWTQARSAVSNLAGQVPTSENLPADVAQLGNDLDDIIANGWDNSNGGANLGNDNAAVQDDAVRAGCQQQGS